MIDYLAPQCRPSTLDSYGNVLLLRSAIERARCNFYGDVLDVGCAHMPYRSLVLSEPSRATRYISVDLPGAGNAPDIEWDGRMIPLPDARVDCAMLAVVLWPVIWSLMRMDKRPDKLGESTLLVGLSACAYKSA